MVGEVYTFRHGHHMSALKHVMMFKLSNYLTTHYLKILSRLGDLVRCL